MHKHASAGIRYQNGKHVLVPRETAHVVHDLGPGCQCCFRSFGFVSVDREQGIGSLLQNAFHDREDAPLFLIGRDELLFSRTRRFAADVNDVRSLG